jgi:hypothetical protein
MKKKAAAKKTSGSGAKKTIVRKIKKAFRSPVKKAVDKKETKQIPSKKKQTKPAKTVKITKTRTGTAAKVKAGDKIKAKIKTKTKAKAKTQTKAKVKATAKVRTDKKTEKTKIQKKDKKVIKKISKQRKEKTEKIVRKTAVKRKEKILSATVKKAAPAKKTVIGGKVGKKTETAEKIGKAEKKVEAGVKGKKVATEKITKTLRKTRPEAEEKVSAKKIRKVAAKKIALRPERKTKAGIMADKESVQSRKKIKTPEVMKKTAAMEVGEVRMPWKSGKGRRVKREVVAEDQKKGQPAEERKQTPVPLEKLPSEYGENGITILVVDPYKLFTFWEVREDTLKMFGGILAIRLYDVSGVDLERLDAKNFYDILLNDRIGSLYIDVSPDREYISDVGVLYDGIFISIARSNKVRSPHAAAEEGARQAAATEDIMCPGY